MINLAVCGLGVWGQRHVKSAKASGRFNVIRGIDSDLDKVQSFAESHGLTLSANIEDALNDPKIDAVTLVTPHSTHPIQIVQAAQAGKHVYTEKPFALSKAEAKRSVDACNEAGVVIALGHDQRFYPPVVELKRLIENGELGAIRAFEANLSHNGGHFAQNLKPVNESDGSTPSRLRSGNWRRDPKEAPAGPLIQYGIHRVDSAIDLMGKVATVHATVGERRTETEQINSIVVSFKFESGAIGTITSLGGTPLNSRLQVFGTTKWAECCGRPDWLEYPIAGLKTLSVYDGADCQHTDFLNIDSVALNFVSFADAIETGEPFAITTDEMIHNVAVIEAVIRSIHSGNTEKIL